MDGTGGTSMFSQMRDRLEKELMDVTTQAVKIKVVTPANTSERKFNVWIGKADWKRAVDEHW